MKNKLTRTAFSAINRITDKKSTYIEAHRGIHTTVPENTMAAFKETIEKGIDSIELDIWLTKDKIPVVIHGGARGELPLTDHPVPIKIGDLLFEDLPNYPINNHIIPSLEEVFNLCQNTIFINMEMKELQVKEGFAKVIEMINKYNMINQIAFSSYNYNYWREVVASTKSFEVGFIGGKYTDMTVKTEKTTWNIYHSSISKGVVENAHERNIGIMAWFGMNDKENDVIYKRLLDIGVDVICSNFPVEAKQYRDEYFKFF